ncbi:DNA-binding protein [Neorhizobium tomejilense]|uniref:DNA-binding protein n=1 Tax=Neorhizobium tomejilense TaxID=2093828 RepID=UPI001FE0E058|nr:DNA-binding protein [Neorhizobium tomejilense]
MDISSTHSIISDRPAQTAGGLLNSRLAKGYSVSELAIATGLTETEIRLAEEGRMQKPDYIRRIKSALE